jgi:hypothetical protein
MVSCGVVDEGLGSESVTVFDGQWLASFLTSTDCQEFLKIKKRFETLS